MTKPLEVGDIMVANYTRQFPDNVTAGREYAVTNVWQHTDGRSIFRIINDRGADIMPIESSFKRKEDAQ